MKTNAKIEPAVYASTSEAEDRKYRRLLFKTHCIEPGEDIAQVVHHYTGSHLKEDDIVFVSDKAVAISQNRSLPLDSIKPRFLARFLSRFVYRSPYGVGLRVPERMELAMQIVGVWKILYASLVAFLGKLLGKRGIFYELLGHEIRGIDGHEGDKPPYYACVILPAHHPHQVAQHIARTNGCEAIVADINDLEGYITGFSSENIKDLNFKQILRDNPMGQDDGMTPLGIIRPVDTGSSY